MVMENIEKNCLYDIPNDKIVNYYAMKLNIQTQIL